MVTVDDVMKAMLEQGDDVAEISDEQAQKVAVLLSTKPPVTSYLSA